jgi:hypothetical protein
VCCVAASDFFWLLSPQDELPVTPDRVVCSLCEEHGSIVKEIMKDADFFADIAADALDAAGGARHLRVAL